jgi:hypothetical protein
VIYNRDVAALRSYFGNQINYQVRSFVPGSANQGPASAVGDIIVGEFAVKLVEDQKVNTCEGVKLEKTMESAMDQSATRDTILEYQVGTGGAEATLDLPALYVFSTKDR